MHDAIIPLSRVRLCVPRLVSYLRLRCEPPSAQFTRRGPSYLGSVILCLVLLLSAQSAKAVDVSVLELYQQGQFETAATRGLIQLLVEPWNHSLRFVVADSLQRGGRYDDAVIQFQALEGTPYAQSATLRLNVLRSLQRAPKLAPPAPTLMVTAQKIVAPTPTPTPTPTPAVTPEATPAPAPPLTKVEVQPVVAEVAVPPPSHPALAQDHLCGAQSAQNPGPVTAQEAAMLAREIGVDALSLAITNDLSANGQQDRGSPQNHLQLPVQESAGSGPGSANASRRGEGEDPALPQLRSVLTISVNPCQQRP